MIQKDVANGQPSGRGSPDPLPLARIFRASYRTSMLRDWGSTAEERALAYPCDRVLPESDAEYFRAVDVDAPPAVAFRWLCQLRAAPYSYDLLDNLGRRSPPTLTPGPDALAVGQRGMTIFTLVRFPP